MEVGIQLLKDLIEILIELKEPLAIYYDKYI